MSKINHGWYLNNGVTEIGVTEPFCTFSDFFSDDEINNIINIGETEELLSGVVDVDRLDITIRNASIAWISSINSDHFWLFRKLTDIIHMANKQFFNYNLEKIEALQYTVYNQGCFYDKHHDMMIRHPAHAVRKLSFTLQLIDEKEYDGGELIMCSESNRSMPRKKGTLIIFPSYTLHEVKKITRGTRKSLVGWIEGPPFK